MEGGSGTPLICPCLCTPYVHLPLLMYLPFSSKFMLLLSEPFRRPPQVSALTLMLYPTPSSTVCFSSVFSPTTTHWLPQGRAGLAKITMREMFSPSISQCRTTETVVGDVLETSLMIARLAVGGPMLQCEDKWISSVLLCMQ